MKKSLLIAATVATLAGTGVGSLAVANADSTNTAGKTTTSHHDGDDRREDRRERLDGKLNQAVTDGVITQAQADSFKAEIKTLHEQLHTSLKAATTKTERQAAHDKFKADLEAWATTNNFPLSKIMPKL